MTGAMAPAKPLTALDLCDRCGAQAYVRVVLPGGGELLFCAHHGRQHGEALARIAKEIQDETDRLSPGKAEAPSRGDWFAATPPRNAQIPTKTICIRRRMAHFPRTGDGIPTGGRLATSPTEF